MGKIKANKGIEDVNDFEEYAVGMWEAFLQTFTKENGLLRDIEEDDIAEETWSFMYTDRGMKLAERMRNRLIKVGENLFPNDIFEIASSYFQTI